MKHSYLTLLILILLGTFSSKAQQDPQYTQYMYNTQVVNPAYAGNREVLSFGLLYRTQWVNFGDGAPNTGTFTVNSPIRENMGLGLSVVNDRIGPAIETNFNIDYSYSIQTSEDAKVSFGLKAGLDILDVDFSKLNIYNPNDPYFQENNIDNKLQPQIGAGVYYNTERFYVGLSVPNFLTTKHFDTGSIENTQVETTAAERMHYFLIAGYVFDLSDNVKFKPAALMKMVSGSPLQADVSANFLLYDRVTLGAAYRWSAAMSGLVGFQATDGIFIGFGYDYQTTDIEAYSDGSYEVMFRFELFNRPERVLTPRFF
ncbi:MAG: hypothetical protein CL526_06010 [Aequorivita sp.]|nr:hypothetical protein [Aequorivita sp.]|tara:strand:- start:131671 stop:132612 length:942 start_codon:yes stop_codon:yes gene_type:complete